MPVMIQFAPIITLFVACFSVGLIVIGLWGLWHLRRSGAYRSLLWWLCLLPGVLSVLALWALAFVTRYQNGNMELMDYCLLILPLSVLLRLPLFFFLTCATVPLFDREAPKTLRVLTWALLPLIFVIFLCVPTVEDCGCLEEDYNFLVIEMFFFGFWPLWEAGWLVNVLVQWGQALWLWIIGGLALWRYWKSASPLAPRKAELCQQPVEDAE